jgi:hypothetical protein
MQIYSRWFAKAAELPENRLFRVSPSPAYESGETMTVEALAAMPRRFRGITFAARTWPDRPRRVALAAELIRRCVHAMRSLEADPNESPPSAAQTGIIRRLALDGLIRWHRSGAAEDLASAAAQARRELENVGSGIR